MTPGSLVVALAAVLVLGAGCTSTPAAGPAEGQGAPPPTTVAAPVLAETPADGSADVSPVAPASVAVTGGTLSEVYLTNAEGGQVQGALDPSGTSYVTNEVLGYGKTYTWSGTAVNSVGDPTPLAGSFTTVTPAETVGARLNVADDDTVGIAAPLIVQFASPIADKAAVQERMTVDTDPPTEGAWAWLPDSQGGARAHWRPKEYWQPGTVVDATLDLYGADYGDGHFAEADMTSHFTIGRSQIVLSDVPSHRMRVIRDGQQVMDVPVSYGKADEERNTTRSGTHVVTEKIEDKLMSNPPYYENVLEKWSVRISNNGEFIHANPETAHVQGSANVSNGCVNLNTENARAYFDSALYGDPVEVTGTDIPLSAADGDIYDWSIPWDQWMAMSKTA